MPPLTGLGALERRELYTSRPSGALTSQTGSVYRLLTTSSNRPQEEGHFGQHVRHGDGEVHVARRRVVGHEAEPQQQDRRAPRQEQRANQARPPAPVSDEWNR